MGDLQIERLRSLVAVATFAGVSPAAHALRLTRAAVSGHIKKLERDLGCRLVRPLGRGVTLTGDGELLVARSREILDIHDETVAELAPPGECDLVVAATEHSAEVLLPTLAEVLRTAFPGYKLRFRPTRNARARELYRGERADLALYFPGSRGDGYRVAELPIDWIGIPGTDLNRIVVFDRPCVIRDQVMATPTGSAMEVVRECPDLTTVMSAVAAGEGVSPLPRTGPRPQELQVMQGLPTLAPVPLHLSANGRVPSEVVGKAVHEMRKRLAQGVNNK